MVCLNAVMEVSCRCAQQSRALHLASGACTLPELPGRSWTSTALLPVQASRMALDAGQAMPVPYAVSLLAALACQQGWLYCCTAACTPGAMRVAC